MGYLESREDFIRMLDQEHQWPTTYMFKFIVPKGKEELVVALFPKGKTSIKSSSKGKYRSVTSKMVMSSAQEVLDIYEKANDIEGVLAL